MFVSKATAQHFSLKVGFQEAGGGGSPEKSLSDRVGQQTGSEPEEMEVLLSFQLLVLMMTAVASQQVRSPGGVF